MSVMLRIRNLHASAGGHPILRGIDLAIDAGQVHAIMGPNGSGKSTLARVLAGHPEYQVTEGEVLLDGADLLAMDPESRARAGVTGSPSETRPPRWSDRASASSSRRCRRSASDSAGPCTTRRRLA